MNSIEECNNNLSAILEENGPTLIEVIVTTDMEIIPTNSSLMRNDGVLVSKPLEDMYPFLDRDEFAQNMIISPVEGRD